MRSRYEILKKFESDRFFLSLLEKGIISLSVLDRKVYYERFLHEKKQYNTVQAVTNTAIEYGVCEDTVYKAMRYMKG